MIRRLAAAILAFLLLSVFQAFPVQAQVYKWVDEQGNVHYTDNPDLAKRKSGGKSQLIQRATGRSLGSTPSPTADAGAPASRDYAPADVTEAPAEAGAAQPDTPSAPEKSVVLVGDFDIGLSMTGRAEIRATVRNDFDSPVDGLRLDVILFHVNRSRAADLQIPFTGGKKRPSMLMPGESGTFVYETELEPEEIAGYRYRIVWAYGEKVPAPAGGGAAEGVKHFIVNKKTGKVRQAGDEAPETPKGAPAAGEGEEPEQAPATEEKEAEVGEPESEPAE